MFILKHLSSTNGVKCRCWLINWQELGLTGMGRILRKKGRSKGMRDQKSDSKRCSRRNSLLNGNELYKAPRRRRRCLKKSFVSPTQSSNQFNSNRHLTSVTHLLRLKRDIPHNTNSKQPSLTLQAKHQMY